eukprot:1096568-Amphidinium_carterae.1
MKYLGRKTLRMQLQQRLTMHSTQWFVAKGTQDVSPCILRLLAMAGGRWPGTERCTPSPNPRVLGPCAKRVQ